MHNIWRFNAENGGAVLPATTRVRGSSSGSVEAIPLIEGEQPRNHLGQWLSRTHPGQGVPGATAVDDFIAQAEAGGFELIDKEVSVVTPFGQRKYDVAIRSLESGDVYGIEIKSSESAFNRFDQPARQQFAADRWVNQHGAEAVGKVKGTEIDSAVKILWEVK